MYLKKLIKDNRGASLPLVIGLFLLLVILTTTVNQLVINALRASRQIESSDKAYYAAESGMEDALYELSRYGPGYETVGRIENGNSRVSEMTLGSEWESEWEIRSEGVNDCLSVDGWEGGFLPTYCGEITNREKLVISLSTDLAGGTTIDSGINAANSNVRLIDVVTLNIRVRVPQDLVISQSLTDLTIDNDGDFLAAGPTGLNEDPSGNTTVCPYSSGLGVDDDDCDGSINEDSTEDPVILWKIVDDRGFVFQPLRGCLSDPEHSSHPGFANSNICEKDFTLNGNELSIEFDETTYGINQLGSIMDLDTFLHFNENSNLRSTNDRLEMELLVVAPMKAINSSSGDPRPIPITHYEYGAQFTTADSHTYLPPPFFEIRSDGYYRGSKQSITTRVNPETSNELLDLTIIQQ